MRSCSAYNCYNHDKKPEGAGKSFFKFPLNNDETLKAWLIKVKREDFNPTKASLLCSDHFKEEFFHYQKFTNKRFLKPGSIPTISPHRPEPTPRRILNRVSANRTQTPVPTPSPPVSPSASNVISK